MQQSTRLQQEELIPVCPLATCDEDAFTSSVLPVVDPSSCALIACDGAPCDAGAIPMPPMPTAWESAALPPSSRGAWTRPEACDEPCSPPSSARRWQRRRAAPQLRPEVLKGYLPLVRKLVRQLSRHLPPNVQRDDLLGAGLLGLIDSVRRNGGSDGETFAGYAKLRIRGAIVDELRAQDWLSRRAREAAEAEVAGKSCGTVFVSLSEMTPAEESVHLSGGDDPIEAMMERSERDALAGAIAQLPERERRVVGMYYFEGAKLKEIGAELGVSEPRVSQLHARALGLLRGILSQA